MAIKRHLDLPPFSGVGPGNTATCDIPKGPRYHVIWLCGVATAQTATNIIDEVRLLMNGKVQRVFTFAELNALNIMFGSRFGVQGNASGVEFQLPIFLAEPYRLDTSIVEGMAWGTGNLQSYQLEVDIKSGADSGVTLSAFAEVDYSLVPDGDKGMMVQPGVGIISKWYRTEVAINGTTQTYASFTKSEAYQQISLFDSYITKVEVLVDKVVLREQTKVRADAVLTSRDMTPVSTRYDLIFDYDDPLNSALPMFDLQGRLVQDFQLKLTLSDGTPRNISCIYQKLGRPD